MKDFVFSDDFKTVTCPNGKITEFFKIKHEKVHNRDMKEFQFDAKDCSQCPLIEQCIYRLKNGKYHQKSRHVSVYLRHDAVLTDKARVTAPEFTIAYNKRYKIERRFATMVRNHGLRRCRYIRLRGAKIHITMANLACNIVRMVSLLFPPTKSVKI